jgi:hypothetical protein
MEKKTLLTVDVKVSDFEEFKALLLKQQEEIEFLRKELEEQYKVSEDFRDGLWKMYQEEKKLKAQVEHWQDIAEQWQTETSLKYKIITHLEKEIERIKTGINDVLYCKYEECGTDHQVNKTGFTKGHYVIEEITEEIEKLFTKSK